MEFMKEVTDDVLVRGIFTNRYRSTCLQILTKNAKYHEYKDTRKFCSVLKHQKVFFERI